MNKKETRIVSIDKELIFNTNNYHSKTPYVSCFIVWYYLNKDDGMIKMEGEKKESKKIQEQVEVDLDHFKSIL